MNIKTKVLAFLTMAGFGAVGLQGRVSNVAYQLGADAVNGASTAAGGQPMTDPSLGKSATDAQILSKPKAESTFGLSHFDATNNQMLLAETVSTARGDKSVMAARKSGGVIKLTSLAPASPTVTTQDTPTGGTALTTLQNLKFDRVSGSMGRIALRNAADDEWVIVVDAGSGNFMQARCTDGAAAAANVDNFTIADGKLVAGLFANGQTTYRAQANGRIRVLNLSSGAQMGVAKKDNAGTYVELEMDASGDATDLDSLVSGESGEVTNIGSMHWDSRLKRLFIGFSRSTTSLLDANRVPFLVGRFADGTETGASAGDLLVEGLAPTGAGSAAASKVVSFKDDASYSIPFLSTMHVEGTKADGTSFDRPYLIAQINYDVSSAALSGRVFAVPLVSSHATVANIGKANDITDNTFATPAVIGALHAVNPTSTTTLGDVRALVGGGRLPVNAHTDIKAMKVVGHTVLVGAAAGATALQSQIGVWASTAIIDADGVAQGWSPWTRVGGMHEQVYGLGCHPTSGDLWAVHGILKNAALTLDGTDSLAGVSCASFGDGLAAPRTEADALAALKAWDTFGLGEISKKAKADLGGKVLSSRHFHAIRTPGLSGRSLVAFCGEGKCALARTGYSSMTGQGAAATVSAFNLACPESNRDFRNDIDTSTNAFYQLLTPGSDATNPVQLGNIYSCGVAGSRAANEGWLFLGGDNGALVYSTGAGAGWDSVATGVAGLDSLSTVFGTLVPKKIGNLPGPVIALEGVSTMDNTSTTAAIAGTKFMLALTKAGLYRIPLDAATFDTQANATAIVPEKVSLGLAGDERCLFLKMLSNHGNSATGAHACGILVTTKGVYVLDDLANPAVGSVGVAKKAFETSDFSGNVRRVEVLTRTPYSTTTLIDAGAMLELADKEVANIIVTTGSVSSPESAIYVIPVIGQQLNGFTDGNSRQGGFILQTGAAGVLNPVRLASASELGNAKAFGSAAGASAPFVAFPSQTVAGSSTDAHVDVIGGGQNASLGSLSISSMGSNSGGNGGLMLTSRSGSIISQE